ncbi:MAG: hypothetical protein KIH69_003580 [Anaerolineae bacterium]|nr:hypothetical protein [Anaerolineae bacterium]
MDRIILTNAIAAGASEASKDSTAQFVKESYWRLKSLVGRKLAGCEKVSDVRDAIEWVERKPDARARHEVLREAFDDADFVVDEDVINAIRELSAVLYRYAPQTAAQFGLPTQNVSTVSYGAATSKGGIVIRGGGDGSVNISSGPQTTYEYLRSAPTIPSKVSRQINSGGGAYLGDKASAPSPGNGVNQPSAVPSATPVEPPTQATPAAMSEASRLLVQLLNTYFSSEDLDGLCLELGLEGESLPGQSKAAKAHALVAYYERRGQLEELKRLMRIARPNLRGQLIGAG